MSNRTRRGRAAKTAAAPARRADYRQLKNPFTPQTVFSEDQVADLHATALRVLEELGVVIHLQEAREIFAKAGATVDGDNLVRIGRDMVAAAVATAPSAFTLAGGAATRDQEMAEGALAFLPGAGCPNAVDRERGRRPGALDSYLETLKLQQHFDAIHVLGPAVEPQDIPVHNRHYALMRGQLTLSDKPVFVYARGRAQITEGLELLQIARGLDDAAFAARPHAITVINTNSPRQIDRPMAQGIIDFARAGQASIITPFCLAGAMAPVTMAGALTLQHAEALAGITLAQLTRPGAPVIYGAFASNVDMKSGAPAFGTPEHIQASLGSGQLARHIGLPWRSASGSAGAAADAQGAQENALALWGCVLAGATTIIHAAGWLEGGLSFGYEKFIVDMEAVQTLAELCAPIAAEADDFGFRAIADVEPGGHFFATPHTMERYRSAFYPPLVADLSNHGQWVEAGAKSTAERATPIWKDILATFTPPPEAEEIAARIDPYIEKAKAAGGAPTLD